MKATVQYDDYKGTTAADRCDLFFDRPDLMTQTIFDWFNVSLDADNYLFVGVSVYTTRVDDSYTTLYFEDRENQKVVKVVRAVPMQTVLNLFKRFAFQVGKHLDVIDDRSIEEVAQMEDEL